MPFKTIYINIQIQDEPLTRTIIRNLPQAKLIYLNEKGVQQLPVASEENNNLYCQNTLLITKNKGKFLKPCPGTPEYICCLYKILNTGLNCNLGCSYCILQAYFNEPDIRVFVNLEEELENIGEFIDSQPEEIFRVGTGSRGILIDLFSPGDTQILSEELLPL